MTRAPARRRAGFTLVSVILAMVLMSIGVLALVGANATALRTLNTEGVRVTALQIARSALESARARPPATLASEGPTAVDERGIPAADGAYLRTITVAPVDSSLWQLVVEVRPPGARSVVLETQVLRRTW